MEMKPVQDTGWRDSPVQKVLVLGGGSAGFLAAITLKIKIPHLDLVVLRSKELGIIGVGEGTTNTVPYHLHDFLSCPSGAFMKLPSRCGSWESALSGDPGRIFTMFSAWNWIRATKG